MSNIEKSKYLVELYNKLIKEKNEINELITKNKNILYNLDDNEIVNLAFSRTKCSALRVFSTRSLEKETKNKLIGAINDEIIKNMNSIILSTIEKIKKELKIMDSKINRIEEKINDLDQNGFRSETFLKYYERNIDLMENT